MSWAALRAGHTDPDDLKRRVSLEAVITEELGAVFNDDGYSICPFHDDTRPSFRVFEQEGVERAGCWACSWRGDLFDVLQETRGVTFREAVEIATKMVGKLPPPRRRIEKEYLSVEHLEAVISAALETAKRDPIPIRRLIVTRGFRMSVEWLMREWDVGVHSTVGHGTVLVPHHNPGDRPTGYKTRAPRSPLIAAKGSQFPWLYGVWRDQPKWPVTFLVEGESDAWTVSWYTSDERVNVLALPTGAGTPARSLWLDYLADRYVIVMFDGDAAGWEATQRWEAALTARGIAHEVRLVPPGADVAGLPADLLHIACESPTRH